MKKLITISLVAVALFAQALETKAGPRNRAERREGAQSSRIRQGVRSGELTRGEASKLRHDERRIKRTENRMSRDGLSDKEKGRLEKMQDRESKKIYRMKHNDRERGGATKSTGDANTQTSGGTQQ